MLVYDKAYMDIRNKYLIPLTKYTIPYNKLRKENIKEIICSKFTSVDALEGKGYIFHFDNDVLLKALLGDIQMLYIRQIIQGIDVEQCSKVKISANWDIVTNYYYAFFNASLLLRLCFRGNIFLDKVLKKKLEDLVSQVIGYPIIMDSNQFYEVYEDNGEYVLKLSKGDADTHEIVWKKTDSLLDEMLLLTREKSEENLIISSLKKINYKLTNTYPSKFRNKINYQPVYGLNFLDNKLYSINKSINWAEQIISFDDMVDDNQVACIMYSYTKYLETLNENLISEYYEIRGNQDGIMKKINEGRTNKINYNRTIYNI